MKQIIYPDQQKAKNSLYRVVCSRCKTIYDLKQQDLVLRNMKGIPMNSFRCAFCKQRNFFSESAPRDVIVRVLKRRI